MRYALWYGRSIVYGAVVALFGFATISSDAAGSSSEIARVLGCYDLILGSWVPRLALGGDETYLTPPAIIELTSERGPDWPNQGLLVRPAAGARSSVHRYAYWNLRSADQVEVVFTNGFSGVHMSMKFDLVEMRGEAESFWDFPRPVQQAPALLRRRACN
jgi:hypothetical protein